MALNGTADAIIIGAGPSGISMAHSLKHKLGFNNFTASKPWVSKVIIALIYLKLYDKLDGPGGTWRTNTYPGW